MEVLVPFFGLFTSLMMFYYFLKVKKRNLFLLLYYLCSNIIVLTYFELYFSKSTFLEAIFFVHFIPISYLLGPLLYFYIKYSFNQIKFQKRDFFHFLPAIFCFLYALPFYFLPFKDKLLVAHEIVNSSFNFHLNISFFSLEYILYFLSIHLLIYALISLFYLKWNIHKHVEFCGPLSKDFKSFDHFITLLISLQIIIGIYSHGYTSLILSKYYLLFWGISSPSIFTKFYYFRITGISFFLQNLCLFFFPTILLNRKFDVRILTTVKTNNDPVFSDLNYSDKTQLLASQLEVYLIEFPFFDNKFSLKKMSISLHISENDITNYLQTSLKTNFTDWKNGLRINQAIKLINSGQSNFMTIQGIAQSVGILSRSKFIDLFKKQMGMTPSEYIKNR